MDFNKVSVFSVPQVVTEAQRGFSIEDQIEYMAKVSNPGSQALMEAGQSGRLTNYLIKNQHWSPLEMCHVVLKMETTRDISHQLVRHTSLRWQQFSERYQEVNTDNLVVKEARRQDDKNRQNSIDDMDDNMKSWWESSQRYMADAASAFYAEALTRGIAKECARVILPQGMVPTTLYGAGSIRSWYHYCGLRMKNGTQREHADLANKAYKCLNEYLPNLFPVVTNGEPNV
jgi:thymidylate synthase (FAD)